MGNILVTTKEIDKIYEIFIFAEDSCTLDVQKLVTVIFC